MIQLLATKYRKNIAFTLLLLFDLSFFLSAQAEKESGYARTAAFIRPAVSPALSTIGMPSPFAPLAIPSLPNLSMGKVVQENKNRITGSAKHSAIGGPGQPEMSSFKSVGVNNLVNLFTGDFSYNIPLMDVGGYPVNLYYSGEIGPEQEASWVGLGWNINPGNINRNMRGVPDDFDGTEKLVQQQNMKPNTTLSVGLAADAEALGIKWLPKTLTINTGVSFNNYLGISLDLGVKGGVEFKVAGQSGSEKSPAMNLGANVALDLNSRDGLTISPAVSLTGSAFFNYTRFSFGPSLATSYNSHSGIKALQLNEQASLNKISAKSKVSMEGDNVVVTAQRIRSQNSENLYSTSISFARPSYRPAIRVPLVNETFAGHFQLGTAIFGQFGSGEAEVYKHTSSVDPNKVIQSKPMVGYLYAENAMNNPNAVMDFTRLNDREVTPNTPVISAPQYSYDIFSIQGEGTGGTIRAYRSDPGYVRDNNTVSTDKSDAFGVDIGVPGHYGANFNTIKTPTTIGEWISNNNIRSTIAFQRRAVNSNRENVFFANPGESSVLDPHEYDGIGGTNLVRYQLNGDPHSANLQPNLENFTSAGSPAGVTPLTTRSGSLGRRKRTQVIDFLTAEDAKWYGLEQKIRNYDYQSFFDANNNLRYTTIERWGDGLRLPNHISQINVTESDGKRYIYGLPVYNTIQKDFTFTVRNSDVNSPDNTDQIGYNPDEPNPSQNQSMDKSAGKDGYAQITQTPAYAHSFLLSGLLSPDYVDVTGDGITDDDLGTAVKFNYSEIKGADGQPLLHQWRTPMTENAANFNAGNRTNIKDDKGLISYGKRESWYLHSVETKTMIALFTLGDRDDGQSANGENGGPINDHSLKKLEKIELFNKADLKKNGYGSSATNAKPIKTVVFNYDYSLCQIAPDNPGGGKLTLTSIYFTYNQQNSRTAKNRYVFSYGSGQADNPPYAVNSSDRWGVYKPVSLNPVNAMTGNPMKNGDFPYVPQSLPNGTSAKPSLDQNAGAWSLKKILLPSGGQIEVSYESDDYAFVQNKRAANMMTIAGFGATQSGVSNQLYTVTSGNINENNYLFVKVPQAVSSRDDVYWKYLVGVDQIAVRLSVTMPKGQEYITAYANFDDYGRYDDNTIWVKMRPVNSHSPLSLAAIEFIREQLPAQAFPGYDVSDAGSLESIGDALAGMVDAIKSAFSDPVSYLRKKGLAKSVVVANSFARLNNPNGYKYGGGQRVKSIKLKDNWGAMLNTTNTKPVTANTIYDLEYRYETTETINGTVRTISSGVASYEPSIGGEENPFQTILQVADKLPCGPTSYGAVEFPLLESFFPAPVVGYSKVIVTSLPTNLPGSGQKSRSGVGRQVTEFYTAKDFPVVYSHTALDGTTDLQAHDASTTNFLSKYEFDSRTLSQGFLVVTNDMHGKMRSQTSYSEADTTLPVSYTQNYYRNTGANGTNDLFDFVSGTGGGVITSGNQGIDVELMTDTREFKVSSSSTEWQGQVDLFPVLFPFWLPFIWRVTGSSQNIYRAVTATKVVNYHSVLDSIMVMDKGSRVGTRNLLYDAETGSVIVTRTNNEFDKPIYKTVYPAWWAYSGMGPAYRNTRMKFGGISIIDGKFTGGNLDVSSLESGDEFFTDGQAPSGPGCPPTSSATGRLWVLDKNKNNPPFPLATPDYIFIDSAGRPYTNSNTTFWITRSGKRNMLGATVETMTGLASPIGTGNPRTLYIDFLNLLDIAAMEFNEKWQTDVGVIGRFSQSYDPSTCTSTEVADCNGYLQKSINPYRKGLLGNFRPFRTMTFYDTRQQSYPTLNMTQGGTLNGVAQYWAFNAGNGLTPQPYQPDWVESKRITRVNSNGLELESKNAANIYTSALYGYHKTLPIAITNNSPSSLAVYDGFEDNSYTASLDNEQGNPCPSKHLDFTTMSNSSLVQSDSAHTGKYCLALSANNSSEISVPITGGDNLNFNLSFGSTTTQTLNNPGGNVGAITFTNYAGSSNPNPSPAVSFSNGGASASEVPPGGRDASGMLDHSIDIPFDYYIYVPAKTTYPVQMNANMHLASLDDAPIGSYTFNVAIQFVIKDQNNNVVGSFLTGQPGAPGTNQAGMASYTGSITLCPGTYHVSGDMGDFYLANQLIKNEGFCDFNFSIGQLTCYQSLTTQNGCTSTVPIAGDATMLNSGFAFNSGQTMVLSAWVKEGQGPTGSTDPDGGYKLNSLVLYNGQQNQTFLPQGPIIDGWQRYEAVFTPASGFVSIRFVNNGSQVLYLDDLRIHPFNAEMKSYVYDPVSLRVVSTLDENNYATFYEYDEEGTLIRTKVETQKGIKTIKESRSANQRNLSNVQ